MLSAQIQSKPVQRCPAIRPARAVPTQLRTGHLSGLCRSPGTDEKTQRIRAWKHRTRAVVVKSPKSHGDEAEDRPGNPRPKVSPNPKYPNSDKVVSAPDVVSRFIGALNRREHPIIASLLSQDVTYANLALQTRLSGKQAIMGFYKETHSSLPADFQIVVDSSSSGDTQNVGLVWHVEMAGTELPMSKGVSFYQVDDDGRISSITDSPEHMLKLAAPLAFITLPMLNHIPSTVIQLTNLDFSSAMTSAMSSLPLGSSMTDMMGLLQRSMDNPVQSIIDMITNTSNSSTVNTTTLSEPVAPPSKLVDRNGEARTRQPASEWGREAPRPVADPPPSIEEPLTPTGTVRMKSATAISMRELEEPSSAFVDDSGSAPQEEEGEEGEASGSLVAALPKDINLTGVWEKDEARCDIPGYERTLDLMEIKGLARVTARIIEGIEIKQQEDLFSVGFITIVPCFQVTETMKFSSQSKMMRRDLRFGVQSAIAKRTPTGVLVNAEWGSPLAGKTTEEYELQPNGELHIRTRVNVGGKSADMTLVLVKNPGGKDALLAKSRQRNQSLQDVLRRQEQQYGKLPQ